MRNATISAICRMAEADDRIALLIADLGYGVVEGFASKFPERYYNLGICEQALASIAAGMALSGEVAVVYSIANFAVLRCIEQIRDDVCYHNANVKIIGVGGGLAYGKLGATHMATEDIAMARSLPNMRVFAPADPEEALAAAQLAVQVEGPCYIRLAKNGEPVLYKKASGFDASKMQAVKPAGDVALFACGPVLKEAIAAAKLLQESNVDAGVYSVPCVKPLDVEALQKIARSAKLIVTVEEHQTTGGLGGAFAESMAGASPARLLRLGLPDEFPHIAGSSEYLRGYYGLAAPKIARAVLDALGHKA